MMVFFGKNVSLLSCKSQTGADTLQCIALTLPVILVLGFLSLAGMVRVSTLRWSGLAPEVQLRTQIKYFQPHSIACHHKIRQDSYFTILLLKYGA